MIYKINYSNDNLIGGNFFYIDPIVTSFNVKDNKYYLTFGISKKQYQEMTGYWVYSDNTENIAYAVFSKDEVLIKWNLKLDEIYQDDLQKQKNLEQFKYLNLRKINQKGSQFILSKFKNIISQTAKQVEEL